VIHQLWHQAVIFAVHSTRANACGQNVGDRLTDVLALADSTAGMSIHDGSAPQTGRRRP